MAQQAPADAAGAAVYQRSCSICHGDHMEGIPPAFPMLLGIANRYSVAQAIDAIQNGKGRMPPMRDIQGADMDALLRYLGIDPHAQPKPAAAEIAPEDPYVFNGYRKFLDPDGYPAIAPPWGTLSAIDLNTGKYLWKIPLGEFPDLVKQGMKDTGSETYGGPIITAGGVLFIGSTVADRKFRAFDMRTGKLLWQTELPFAGVATPCTYMIDGRQYVVIAASGGRDPKGPVGGTYVAFALPK
jgi:cytochrome c553